MPIKSSYPGVYIEEVPRGIRTISGVETSVTAFIVNDSDNILVKQNALLTDDDIPNKSVTVLNNDIILVVTEFKDNESDNVL